MNQREYSTRSSEHRPLDAIADILAAAARLESDGRGRLLAPQRLQSWPGIVHGGGLVALLDSAARAMGGATGPWTVHGRLTASVPTETALELEGHEDHGTVALTVLQDGQVVTSGAISPLDARDDGAAWAGGGEGAELPMSDDCLACGALNPLGLQVRLRFDQDGVWAGLEPREAWREPDDRVHPALGPVLLDEVAWWLGALTMKEGGLTNRISVTLLRPDAPVGGPLIAAGRFERVTPVDRKPTFWRTETALMAADGTLLATASIVFRGGAEYSARQIAYFRPRTPPEIFCRMFPNHAR